MRVLKSGSAKVRGVDVITEVQHASQCVEWFWRSPEMKNTVCHVCGNGSVRGEAPVVPEREVMEIPMKNMIQHRLLMGQQFCMMGFHEVHAGVEQRAFSPFL
jgi:hypothetical protein